MTYPPPTRSGSNSPDSKPLLFSEDDFGHSPAVPAILWLLGTTTDPESIIAAAKLAVVVNWDCSRGSPHDSSFDIYPALEALRSGFIKCFSFEAKAAKVYTSTIQNAIDYGKAYCVIRCLCLYHHSQGNKKQKEHLARHLLENKSGCKDKIKLESHSFTVKSGSPKLIELRSVYNAVRGSMDYFEGIHESMIDWALYVLPSLSSHSDKKDGARVLHKFLEDLQAEKIKNPEKCYPAYLYALNVLLGLEPQANDMLVRDKR